MRTIKFLVSAVVLFLGGMVSYFVMWMSRYLLNPIMPRWFSRPAIPIIGVLLFCYILYRFLMNAFKEIPAEPPHKAILVFWGKRQRIVLSEGWHFFPLYPIVFSAVKINVTKNNIDLPKQEVMTPDQASLGVTLSITITPGAGGGGEEEAKLLIAYLNSGGGEGVKKIYEDVIQDRLRGWAFSGEEGPATWQEAKGAKDDAIATLIKAILGDDVPSIPGDIPTSVLLRYFNSPQKLPLEFQKQKWGRKKEGGSEWEGLEEQLARFDEETRSELERAVNERRNIIARVKAGNGDFVNKNLGITINRFTINNVALEGKTAEAADRKAQELEERRAEITELQHVSDRVKELVHNNKMSMAQAIEVVQSERGKVVKTVSETKINASTELLKALKGLADMFIMK